MTKDIHKEWRKRHFIWSAIWPKDQNIFLLNFRHITYLMVLPNAYKATIRTREYSRTQYTLLGIYHSIAKNSTDKFSPW